MDRTNFLLQGIDRNSSHGIEIGPFYSPIAPKATGWNTTIVDFASEAILKETARNHSVAAIRDLVNNIEPVDIVWRDKRLDDACLAICPDGYDFLIASHVIEHIPNIVGFLQQVSRLARPGFVLSLAVPDCRLTFDFFKPVSNTSHALLAHRENRMIHSPETIFDTHAYMVHMDKAGAWSRDDKGAIGLATPISRANEIYTQYLRLAMNGTQDYVDAHCWVFTPSSFELMILELNDLGYIDFSVTKMARGPCSEFLVQLRRQPHKFTPEELQERRLALLAATRRELANAVKYLPEADF